jgi:LuxR family transcriptional regulator, maltose regulon positive regulatory protein
MELAMPVMCRDRREAELARWIRALPDAVLQTRPVLGVAFVGALAQASDFGSVGERLDRIEAGLRSADGTWPEQPPPGLTVVDQDNYRSLPTHIEMYRAALALASADLASTISHAQQALSLAPREDALARAAAGALAGLASWSTGDLSGAHAAYTESVAGLTGAGFRADVLGCTITLGDICRTQGRLSDAVRTYQAALDSTPPPPPGAEPLRGTADMHTGLAGVFVERNQLDLAREQLAIGERLGKHNGLPQNPYRSRVVLARLCEADGDLDGALSLLEEAERVYVGDYAPHVQPVPAVRARLRLRRGELAAAEQWARERQLAAGDEPSYLREYEHLTLARLRIAQHRAQRNPDALQEALALLDALLGAAEGGGRAGSVLEVLLLQALASDAAGEAAPARTALNRAVGLAEPEGYVRLFADEGAPMAALLKAQGKQPHTTGYLRQLLAATTGTAAPATVRTELVDPLSERECQVLRLLGGELDGPDIARELSVSLNTLRTHTKNIYAKLGVSSRRAAVRRARDLELIPGRRHS